MSENKFEMNTARAGIVRQSLEYEHTSSEGVDNSHQQTSSVHGKVDVPFDGAAGDHAPTVTPSIKTIARGIGKKSKRKPRKVGDDLAVNSYAKADIFRDGGSGDNTSSINAAIASIDGKLPVATSKTDVRLTFQYSASQMFALKAENMIFTETESLPNGSVTEGNCSSARDKFFADAVRHRAALASTEQFQKIFAIGSYDVGTEDQFVAKNISFGYGDDDHVAIIENGALATAVQLILIELIDASVCTAAGRDFVLDSAVGDTVTTPATEENSKLEVLHEISGKVINASIQSEIKNPPIYSACDYAAGDLIHPAEIEQNISRYVSCDRAVKYDAPSVGTEKESTLEIVQTILAELVERNFPVEVGDFTVIYNENDFGCPYHAVGNTCMESELEAVKNTSSGVEYDELFNDVEEIVLPSATCGQISSKIPVICQFYSRGTCRYGNNCKFLHDLSGEENLSSTYYQNFEHDSMSTASISPRSRNIPDWYSFGTYMYDMGYTALAESEIIYSGYSRMQYQMCPLEGPCPHGQYCAYGMHLQLCKMCDKYCLHPNDKDQRRKHHKECLQRHEQDMELAFAIAKSKDKVCSICLDIVMERADREKRFGILSDCSHLFCLSCIRNWRSTHIERNKDAGRSCPLCRIKSDFVIPSAFWPDTKEEKDKLFQKYRSALRVRDCKYFNKGAGICKFGNKCFYKHALPSGEIVDVGSPRRHRF